MKLLEYKQFNNSTEERSLNKKKVIIAIIIILLIVISIAIGVIYSSNQNFRNFMDSYILFKNIDEDGLPYINIDSDENIYTYAYYNYVVVLADNKLTLYDSSGKEVQSFEMTISSPIFAAQDNYLLVAEKNNQKLYFIKDKKLLWEKDVEGKISRVNINENGFVSVIVSGTSHKSVITTFTEDGSEVFKTYLSNTYAIDVDISMDNKFLSFCEMDLSGTLIESKVKTISIEKAKQDPKNAYTYTYEIPSHSLVTNLEYHEKEELICQCDTNIYLLKDGVVNNIAEFTDEGITFAGVGLSKSYFNVKEEKFGINNQNSKIEICNTSNHSIANYLIKGIAKDVYAKDNVIVANLGTEAYFIDEKGWLIKKYTSNQEIKNIVISNNIAGIIYRNKITFLGL